MTIGLDLSFPKVLHGGSIATSDCIDWKDSRASVCCAYRLKPLLETPGVGRDRGFVAPWGVDGVSKNVELAVEDVEGFLV